MNNSVKTVKSTKKEEECKPRFTNKKEMMKMQTVLLRKITESDCFYNSQFVTIMLRIRGIKVYITCVFANCDIDDVKELHKHNGYRIGTQKATF